MKIEISDEIAKKLQKNIDKSDKFDSINKYVEHILKQVIKRLGEKESSEEEIYSKEDEEKIKERLRGLGYLD